MGDNIAAYGNQRQLVSSFVRSRGRYVSLGPVYRRAKMENVMPGCRESERATINVIVIGDSRILPLVCSKEGQAIHLDAEVGAGSLIRSSGAKVQIWKCLFGGFGLGNAAVRMAVVGARVIGVCYAAFEMLRG